MICIRVKCPINIDEVKTVREWRIILCEAFLCFEEGAASDKNLASDFNLVLDLDGDKTEHGGGGGGN